MDEDGYREMIAAYYGMISHIDDQVGRLVDCLESRGQLENTLIIFTSDHGDYNGDRKLIRKGPSLMGSLLYTPFIAAAPGTQHHRSARNSASMKTSCRPSWLQLVIKFPKTCQATTCSTSGAATPSSCPAIQFLHAQRQCRHAETTLWGE